MAAPISAPTALRNDFRRTISEALALNECLELIVGVKDKTPSEGFHGKVSHSPAPWNSAVANAILDLHAWARKTEVTVRRNLSLPIRERGTSIGNTEAALNELGGNLANALDDDTVSDINGWLSGWCRRAYVILGKTEDAKRLPRLHGAKESSCPWCKRNTLRQLALEGLVFCIDPGCVDEEGRRPKAQLEYFRGDMVLRWQDGIIGAP